MRGTSWPQRKRSKYQFSRNWIGTCNFRHKYSSPLVNKRRTYESKFRFFKHWIINSWKYYQKFLSKFIRYSFRFWKLHSPGETIFKISVSIRCQWKLWVTYFLKYSSIIAIYTIFQKSIFSILSKVFILLLMESFHECITCVIN